MKNKNNIPDMVRSANILIYDDDNITYYDGKVIGFNQDAIIDSGTFINGGTYTKVMGYRVAFDTSDLKKSENIKLDDTTMKRIAKFNKEQECKRLDEKIKEKKEKIKELDEMLTDKEKRWKKVQEFIANIYDLDIDDDDRYDYY